jgi:hypothetical protein
MRKLATVRKIANVLKHQNADTLSIYIIDGWQVIKNSSYQAAIMPKS